MDNGKIPINKHFEFEYRYHDKDQSYKYFNRKFEIYLLERKTFRPQYILHMDNGDTRNMAPGVYKADKKKKYNFGVTSLNWNDIKSTFLDIVVGEIGEEHRDQVKKALVKLSSPKI